MDGTGSTVTVVTAGSSYKIRADKWTRDGDGYVEVWDAGALVASFPGPLAAIYLDSHCAQPFCADAGGG